MVTDRATVWLDQGWWVTPAGFTRLLSWNAATQELKLWATCRWHDDVVLGRFETEEEVLRRLDGYDAYCETPDGLGWLAARVGVELDWLLTRLEEKRR